MPDRVFFPLTALAAILLIALAFVWPQGLGRRSPKPFGYETASQIAARTPRLRPAADLRAALPPPILSPALAPEPSAIPTPMAVPAPAPTPSHRPADVAPMLMIPPHSANTVQP
jgi:hypothetical protein